MSAVIAAPTTNQAAVLPRREEQPAQRKRTLGSMLSANVAIVDTTASIARPFVTPKTRPSSFGTPSSDTTGRLNEPTDAFEQPLPTSNARDKVPVGAFPAVARRVLSAPDVSQLYAFVRQLHDGQDVDAALEAICSLLQGPNCQELIDLMPKVLGGAISGRFIGTAKARGLHVSALSEQAEVAAPRSSSGISSFFAKLQQSKRRRQHGPGSGTAAAVIKDPQCSVCYEITRKAYASKCGHICCMTCWKKVRWRRRELPQAVSSERGFVRPSRDADRLIAFVLPGFRWRQMGSRPARCARCQSSSTS